MMPDHNNQLWERCQLAWKMHHEKQNISKIHEAPSLFRTISGYSHFFENRIYTGELVHGNNVYKNFVEALILVEWSEAEQQQHCLLFIVGAELNGRLKKHT